MAAATIHWNIDFYVQVIVYEGDTDLQGLKNLLSMKGFDYKVKHVSKIGCQLTIRCNMKKAGKLYRIITKN